MGANIILITIGTALASALAILWMKKQKQGECENAPKSENDIDFSGIDTDAIPKDSKKIVEMNDIVVYFKGLMGKIKQGEDTPFIAKASAIAKITPDLSIENSENVLLLATYNEQSEMVENMLLIEYQTLGETIKKMFEKSENGIVTLS